MKNKWKLIVIFIILILINPKIFTAFSSSFNKKTTSLDNFKKINVGKDVKYTEYKSNIVIYEQGTLRGINKNGDEIFNLELGIKNPTISSNKYIDILDKEKSVIYSVNEKGKVVLKRSMKKSGLVYKSLENDSYIYIFKKDKKNIANIYDFEFNLVKSIELDGVVTDIEYTSNKIYLCLLKIDKSIESKILSYDYNGNLEESMNMNQSVLLNLGLSENGLYVIEKNKITKLSNKLKTINSFNIDDLKNYSNINDDKLYIIENDGDILLIKDKEVEKIKVNEKNINKILNLGYSFIAFTDNKILDSKGKEIKIFDENIKHVSMINNKLLFVILENSYQLFTIK
ncbi:DUF5711 family protein [Paraclostridium sordellii]|uniref:DUF5711 family protein n=3 Tax=Paraclostridium sordellii TaxID=1505 RepID=UPI0022E1D128|nr:DUF5711 family protein [Paeniclostridium sordellii]